MAYQPIVRNKIDDNNSSTIALGSGAEFLGGWTDVTNWSGLSVIVSGLSASTAPGTLQMQFSTDGITEDRVITIAVNDVSSAPPRTLAIISKFFRLKYTNGIQAQTTFSIQTLLHTDQVNLISRIDQDLQGNEDVTNVRAVITGVQPDGDYVNTRADGSGFTNNTPLLVGETYISPWVDTDGFNGVDIFISTNQLSADNGIRVDYTDDVQAGVPTILASEHFSYTQNDVDRGFLELSFKPRLDGFRVSFTNNSVDQTSFFIQSDLRTNRQTGRFDNSGSLIVGSFEIEAALGNVPNHFVSTKFGSTKLIDAADVSPTSPATIWRLADDGRTPLRVARKTFQTSSDTLYISSNNAADTNIEITMVINNGSNNIRTVTATTNAVDGRTPVNTGITALDCNTAYVSGNNQTLTGDVYVVSGANITPATGVPSDPTKVLAFIPQEDQRTQQSVFRVPFNAKMIIKRIYSTISAGTNSASATILLKVKSDSGSWLTIRPYLITTSIAADRVEGIVLEPNSLVECILSEVSGNNVNCLFNFDYELIFGA